MQREKRDATRIRGGDDFKFEAKCGVQRHRKQLKRRVVVLLALLSSSLWILFQIDLNMNYRLERLRLNHGSGFIINTQGCRVQNLNLFDVSIQDCVLVEEKPKCHDAKERILVRSTVDSLYVVEGVAKLYLQGDDAVFTCCYLNFWKENYTMHDGQGYPDNFEELIRFGDKCHQFHGPAKVPFEFVKVVCNDSNDDVFYEDYFAFSQTKLNSPKLDERLNVLIVGLDAVSRLNFHRQLPSVLAFLEERGSIEFLGYNKVGDNTFPNLIPFLTGLTEKELQNSCQGSSEGVFDDCDFLWRRYKEKGFVTGFGEDSVKIGTFQYEKHGFKEQPTDFYTHPYHLLAEANIGKEKRLNCHLCIGNRYSFQLVLDEALSFAVNQKNNSNFGFFWINSISHDFLNLPRFANNPIEAFYQQLESHGILNSTVIILMSDHGIRWGKIRRTYQGFFEERLPGMFIVFPGWFRKKYSSAYANIRQNRKRLTTPFDVYETLLDLVDLNSISEGSISKRLKNRADTVRGISLFLPVPGNRTCQDAGIPTHWCTCRITKSVPLQDPIVGKLTSTLVGFINDLVSSHKQCAQLRLHKIREIRLEAIPFHDNELLESMASKDYVVTIQTQPGLGIFEATVTFISETNEFITRTPVSRINTYGNQSLCMDDYHLKLYCYCALPQKDVESTPVLL